MKKIMLSLLLLVLMAATAVASATRGTPAQAMKMLDKAVAFYSANGQEKAFAEFNKPDGQFVSGDIYIFVINKEGNVLAHGANAKLIGKDMSGVKDADGKLFAKELAEVGSVKGSGTVEYKWTNPESKKTEPKITYVKKAGDVIICCGAYK